MANRKKPENEIDGKEDKEKEEENFKISSVGFSEFGEKTAESLESEVEEASKESGGREAGEGKERESFEDFTAPMSVREIAAPVLASASISSAAEGIEGEVAGIGETESSRERREQAARTPIADYTAGAYERNYWVGGGERTKQPKDIEMGITRAIPRRDIMEIPDETRRIDFSAWQRSMESQDARGAGRSERDNSEEYLVDVRRAKEETRLPFERREEKRKYRL